MTLHMTSSSTICTCLQRKMQGDNTKNQEASPCLVVEQKYSLFITDKLPEVNVKVVAIHLDLLEAKLPENAHTGTLNEGLEKTNKKT